MHYKRPPVQSTLDFVSKAPTERLKTGLRAVVEVVGYPDGHVQLIASRVTGRARERTITQGPFLNFVDADEAKDGLDLLVDRLASEA